MAIGKRFPRNHPLIIGALAIYLVCLAASFSRLQDLSAPLLDAIRCGISIQSAFLMLVYGVYCYERLRRPTLKDAPTAVASVLISIFWQFGAACAQMKTILPLFLGVRGVFITLLTTAVLSLFIYSLLAPLFEALMKCKPLDDSAEGAADAGDWGKPWEVVISIAPVLLTIAWLPILIPQLPGSTSSDMASMIGQYYGIFEWSTHHPLQASILYGFIFSIGDALGGADCGVFAITLVQAIAWSCALSFELKVLKRIGVPKAGIGLSFAFFMLNPLFASYVQWAVKDSLFGAAFVLYVSLFALYAKSPKAFTADKKLMVAMVVVAYAVGVLRNNGFYIVLLSLPFLALFHDVGKVKALAPLLLVIVLIPISNAALQAGLSAESGSVREALSIPFQQTARYASEHSEDVEDWERDAIDAVLGYDSLADRYKWNVSNPVKDEFKQDGSLGEYFKAWFAQGLRHPICYANATLLQTYGYWFPAAKSDFGVEFCGYDMPNTEVMPWHKWQADEVSSTIEGILRFARSVPFANYLLGMGVYTWISIIAIALLFRSGKGKLAVCLLPGVLLLLTCVAGPLNGSMRYGIGMVAILPVVVGVAACAARGAFDRSKASG